MTDEPTITPQHEPEVSEAISMPDPKVRRLARIKADYERSKVNMAPALADARNKAKGRQ